MPIFSSYIFWLKNICKIRRQSFLGLMLDLHLFNLPTSHFPSTLCRILLLFWQKGKLPLLFNHFITLLCIYFENTNLMVCIGCWNFISIFQINQNLCCDTLAVEWKHVLMTVAALSACLLCWLCQTLCQTCTMRKSQKCVDGGFFYIFPNILTNELILVFNQPLYKTSYAES